MYHSHICKWGGCNPSSLHWRSSGFASIRLRETVVISIYILVSCYFCTHFLSNTLLHYFCSTLNANFITCISSSFLTWSKWFPFLWFPGRGIYILYEDVKSCQCEDVHVLWSILVESNTSSMSLHHWSYIFVMNNATCTYFWIHNWIHK